MRRRVGEQMISVFTGLHREACRRRCDGDTVSDLFRFQGTLNQHVYHSIPQEYAIPSGLHLVGLSFVFQQGNDPTHLQAVLGLFDQVLYQMMECCIRWPGLHNHLTSTQLRWFGMSWTAEWRKSSKQVLSICGNSFNTVGKAFQVTTSWSGWENAKSV